MYCLRGAFVDGHRIRSHVKPTKLQTPPNISTALSLPLIACACAELPLTSFVVDTEHWLAPAVHGHLFESKPVRQMVAKGSDWTLQGRMDEHTLNTSKAYYIFF